MQNDQIERDSQDDQSAHITTKEAADWLGVSVSTVRRYGRRLGHKRFGRWRLDPEAVRREGGAA